MAEVGKDFAEDIARNGSKYIRINNFIEYVEKKFNEESNIDYNYINIGKNNYVKNYIGFESEEDINKFEKLILIYIKKDIKFYFFNLFVCLWSFFLC